MLHIQNITMLTRSTMVNSKELKLNSWLKKNDNNNYLSLLDWHFEVKTVNIERTKTVPEHDHVIMVNHGQQSRTTNKILN